MKQDFKIKNILILFAIFTVLYFAIQNVVSPFFYRTQAKIDKFVLNNIQKQNIAPQRLYVNAWRLTKNEFIDKSMNNQDWYRWRNRYLKHIKTAEDANVAINTMLYSLHDPYTKFLKAKSYLEQKEAMESQVTSLGLLFDKYGDDFVISSVFDDKLLKEQTLLPGDKIVSINNIPIEGLTAEQIALIIEKIDKKNIKIKVLRDEKPIVKTIAKIIIPIDTMQYYITKNNIGIINMANVMGENAISDFKNILHQTNDTNGLIIDLRNNYGGLLTNAILMSDYMSDNKKLISIISKGQLKYELYGDRPSIFKEKPLIILVNSKTASAAEVLAGILRDNLGAIIVGETTYGKNTIQQVVPLSNNTGIMITSDKYILPNGEDINKTGISPDITVPNSVNKDVALLLSVKLINNVMKI